MSRRYRDDALDESVAECTHEESRRGQYLVRAHEQVEVVVVDGFTFVRRSGSTPCPDHLEAIRRARRFSEQPAANARLTTKEERR